jgi:hypothetical protein
MLTFHVHGCLCHRRQHPKGSSSTWRVHSPLLSMWNTRFGVRGRGSGVGGWRLVVRQEREEGAMIGERWEIWREERGGQRCQRGEACKRPAM